MFNGAMNFVINGGLFTANIDDSSKVTIGPLIAEVAPNAILNADGRKDVVRCHPGTRVEVIRRVEKWIDDKKPDRKRIMWLRGPPGAGKSAILQTVVERCNQNGRHAASFFFFSGDNTRSHARPLVATLAYQLRRFYPELDKFLTDSLRTDPLVFGVSIEAQFKALLSSPIRTAQQSSSVRQPIILIIDGLDECDDKSKQEQILSSLHVLADARHSPFLVLVASRNELHLSMTFNKIGRSVEFVVLDNKYRPQDDIRRFVVDRIAEIKRDPLVTPMLRDDWPAEADIKAIVDKSSGQFMYAAAVVHTFQRSVESLALSLDAIHPFQPPQGAGEIREPAPGHHPEGRPSPAHIPRQS